MSRVFRSLAKTLVRKKNDVALVALWIMLISFVIMKVHWTNYLEVPRLQHDQVPFALYEGPTPTIFDLAMIGIAGMVVGFFISDAKEMAYGFIAAILGSFIITVTYVTLYIWIALDWGPILGVGAFDWEFAVYWAIMTVFRIMVPWVVGLCLVGLALAAFLRTWIFWS